MGEWVTVKKAGCTRTVVGQPQLGEIPWLLLRQKRGDEIERTLQRVRRRSLLKIVLIELLRVGVHWERQLKPFK